MRVLPGVIFAVLVSAGAVFLVFGGPPHSAPFGCVVGVWWMWGLSLAGDFIRGSGTEGGGE
jgi:hypothetical protein